MTHAEPLAIRAGALPTHVHGQEGRPYGAASRLNRWLAALVMLGMLGLGFVIARGGLGREVRAPLLDLHRSAGTASPSPSGLWVGDCGAASRPRSPGLPRWQARAPRATHWLLLAGVPAMPLSGVLMTTFGGRAIEVFGLVAIPEGPEVAWVNALAGAVHDWAGYGIAGPIALHVAAALKHHLVDGDGTLRRMLPAPGGRLAPGP